MRIILVRHGETIANFKRIHQSHTHGKLSKEGLHQSIAVGNRLRHEHIDAIYSSNLNRAKETLSFIKIHHPNIKVIYDKHLQERSQGIFDGKPYGTFDSAAKSAGMSVLDFKPKGAESLKDMEKRVFDFLDYIIKKENINSEKNNRNVLDRTILIVSHGGPIRSILKRYTNNSSLDPRNTAVSIIEFDKRKGIPVLINDTTHLQGEGPSRIILIMHGEVVENVKNINCGHRPGKITKKGREQEQCVAHRLRNMPIDAIYTSDLYRAVSVARAIKAFHAHTPIYLVPALRECSQGVYEGTQIDSMSRAAELKNLPFTHFRPRGGESIMDLKRRVKGFFELLKEEEHGVILIVSHGGVICNLLLHLFKLPNKDFQKYLPDNTAVAIIDFKLGKPKLTLLNCTKHLK